MKMNVKPLGARALIRRIVPGEAAKGSIIMPDTVKSRHRWGEVVAIGDGFMYDVSHPMILQIGDPGGLYSRDLLDALAASGRGKTMPCPFAVGDRVLLPKHACSESYADRFDHEGEELLVLEYKELLAVVTS